MSSNLLSSTDLALDSNFFNFIILDVTAYLKHNSRYLITDIAGFDQHTEYHSIKCKYQGLINWQKSKNPNMMYTKCGQSLHKLILRWPNAQNCKFAKDCKLFRLILFLPSKISSALNQKFGLWVIPCQVD